MSDRHTSNIFLTQLPDDPYGDFGRKTVTANRHTQPLIRMHPSLSSDFKEASHVTPADCRLPNDEERQAWQLRKTMGLKDSQIADMLRTTRETVNRRISRYRSKVKALSLLCPSASCELLERLATN